MRFYKKLHAQYIDSENTVDNDCKYIVALCHIIVEGILKLLIESRSMELAGYLSPNAA